MLSYGSDELAEEPAAESGSEAMEQPDGGQEAELHVQMEAAAQPMAQQQIPMDAAPLVPLQDAMEAAAAEAPMAAPQEPLGPAATTAAFLQQSDAAWELEQDIRFFVSDFFNMKKKATALKQAFERLPPEHQEYVVRRNWMELWEMQRYGYDISDRFSTIAIKGYRWIQRSEAAGAQGQGVDVMAAGAAAAPAAAAATNAIRGAVAAVFAAELAEADAAKRQREEQEVAAAAEEAAREQEEEQKREAAMAAAAADATQQQEERLALEAANAAAEAAAKEAAELREKQRATAAEAAELREMHRVVQEEAAGLKQQLQQQLLQQKVRDGTPPRKSALDRLGPRHTSPQFDVPAIPPGSNGDGYVPRSGNRDCKSNGYVPRNSTWDGYDPSSGGLDGSYRRGRSPVRRNEYAAAAAGGSWDREDQTLPMWPGNHPSGHNGGRSSGRGLPSRSRERARHLQREQEGKLQEAEHRRTQAAAAAAAAAAAVAGSSRPQHKFDMQRSPAGKPKRERSRSPPYPNPGYRRYGVVAAEGGVQGSDGVVIKWHEPGSCKAGIDNCSICMLVDAHRRKLFPTPF